MGPVLAIEDAFGALHGFFRKEGDGDEAGRASDALIAGMQDLVEKLEQLQMASDSPRYTADFVRQVFAGEVDDANTIGDSYFTAHRYCLATGRSGDETCNRAFATLMRRPAQAAWRACLAETENLLDALWEERVFNQYQSTLRDRFPFNSDGADAAVSDFADFFGPQGAVATFVAEELAPFLDLDAEAEPVLKYGYGLRLEETARTALLQATTFRDVLFPEGARLPRANCELTPRQVVSVSGTRPYDARSVVRVGTIRVVDTGGQQPTVSFPWPDERPSVEASVSVTTDEGVPTPIQVASSSWAIFRLLARGEVTPRGDSTHEFDVRWRLERRGAYVIETPYILRAEAAINPFQPDFFTFSCPLRLSEPK
jgi:type VI protein secretion system component VasK